MRGLAEMSDEFEEPFVLDTVKYEAAFNPRRPPRDRDKRDDRLVPEPTEYDMTGPMDGEPAELTRGRPGRSGCGGRRLHPTRVRGVLTGARRPEPHREPRKRTGSDGNGDCESRWSRTASGSPTESAASHQRRAKRIERSVSIATVIELVASFAFPVIVIAAGHSDWVLPSIAITIGPLLLRLDHLVDIPRFRPVGWALTAAPFVLVAAMSGSALRRHHRPGRRRPAAGYCHRRLPRPLHPPDP